jgi:hypothetical protein
MRKKRVIEENFLDKIPSHKEGLSFSTDENGNVTLEMENTGVVNKIAQVVLRKPKISYIHLEEFGSFIWPLIDGKTDIHEIGEKVQEHFGDKANPLYERLSVYFKTLESYGFVEFK